MKYKNYQKAGQHSKFNENIKYKKVHSTLFMSIDLFLYEHGKDEIYYVRW